MLLPGPEEVNAIPSPKPTVGVLGGLQAHKSGWRGPKQMRDPVLGSPIFRKKPSSN